MNSKKYNPDNHCHAYEELPGGSAECVEHFNLAVETVDLATDFAVDRVTDPVILAAVARHFGLEMAAQLIEKYQE